ncbi:MAG: alpha/beta hydrolase [Gemmatimonadaceae bacterium]|nr:alpha/beta hydrolase [Gemmatimonadaceae bacterium]
MTAALHARTLAGVPTLIGTPPDPAAPAPVVLWFHGYSADALAHAAELERCAAAGFLAVGIDAVGHGARRDRQLAARIAASPAGVLPVMLDLIEETVAELEAVVDALGERYPIDRQRLSAVGISMGAFLVYRAIAAGLPLRASVALLGSPEWPRPASPHHRIDAFQHVSLLSITAEFDVSVPPAPTRRFHEALRAAFPSADRHQHHALRGAGHLTNAAQWQEAMDTTLAWLQRHG